MSSFELVKGSGPGSAAAGRHQSRRLRVAHVITGLELGGGGAVVLTIARALDRARFDMDVFCIHEGGDLEAELRELGVRVVLLEGAWDYRRRFLQYSPRQTVRLASMLREGRYDIVHTHIFQADAIGRIAARMAGTPAIVKSLHNMGAWKRRRHILADRMLNRWTDAVICCSAFQSEVAIVQEHLGLGDAVVINNGVDVRRFESKADPRIAASLGLDPGRPIVGTVGRMIEAKGHEYLIDAVSQVRARRPDAQFLFVGDGGLREMLWQRLPEEARPHVCFAGARPDIPELLALMSIFAFPSVSEGFPIAPLEAMASRLPVVSSDIRPLRDIVVDGETGFLVPERDSEALARAITTLLENPIQRAAFGAKARRRVETQFSDVQMVRATERLYERILVEKGLGGDAVAASVARPLTHQSHEPDEMKS
jgi:glycosyltransferase involved in cell wall biosynthesis